jgi:hypothetical protein
MAKRACSVRRPSPASIRCVYAATVLPLVPG